MTILELIGAFALFFAALGGMLWYVGALQVSVEWDRG